MLALLGDQDTLLDSNFELWIKEAHIFDICQHSSGGGAGRGNRDYLTAQQKLLERFAEHNMTISNVFLVSGTKGYLYDEDRPLGGENLEYPIIPTEANAQSVRHAINNASQSFGKDLDGTRGNLTKRLVYRVEWLRPAKVLASEVRNALGLRGATREAKPLKYGALGRHLAMIDVDAVYMTLEDIEGLIGDKLPEGALERQFWANAANFHGTRRQQWLDHDFEAFLEPENGRVRFERKIALTTDQNLQEARIRRERRRLRALQGDDVPPAGSESPELVLSSHVRYRRDYRIVAWVLENANGKCEACSSNGPFQLHDDEHFLEVHHVRPLAEGGPDTIDNAVAICPNCHRELHLGKKREAKKDAMILKVKRLIDHPRRSDIDLQLNPIEGRQ